MKIKTVFPTKKSHKEILIDSYSF